MFDWKSITKMPTPAFSLDFAKVGIGILVIDFYGNILMSSDGFQNLLNKFLFNLRRHSTLYDFPFQSYDQSKMSNSVTVWHSDPSIYVDKPNTFTNKAQLIDWNLSRLEEAYGGL